MSDISWEKISVAFRLKSPLHLGYIPFKGSIVSPTRYYIPGKNLWGAVTKRITEHLYEKPNANNYREIGIQVMKNFIFSYFYIYDGETVYFPLYTEEGLKYGDNKNLITKSEFEYRFIGSIISTSIDNTGTVKYGSLHEIEFINNRFKDKKGNFKHVKIAGCIWINNKIKINENKVILNDKGIFIDDFNVIEELILGGESKYGLGHVVLHSVYKIKFPDIIPFNCDDPEKIEIQPKNTIAAHLMYSKGIKFRGDIELLSGRGYYYPEYDKPTNKKCVKPGEIILTPKYYLCPGTEILRSDELQNIKLAYDGTMTVE